MRRGFRAPSARSLRRAEARAFSASAGRRALIKLEIDGKEVEIEQGSALIQACEKAGATIPRFCYHDRLNIAGNCRMRVARPSCSADGIQVPRRGLAGPAQAASVVRDAGDARAEGQDQLAAGAEGARGRVRRRWLDSD